MPREPLTLSNVVVVEVYRLVAIGVCLTTVWVCLKIIVEILK